MKTQLLKVIGILAIAMIATVSVGYSVRASQKLSELEASAAKAATIEASLKTQEEADMRLGQYVINTIYKVGAGNRISNAKKLTLAWNMVKACNEIFTRVEHAHAFITVIAIESSFNQFAQSPTGPKGYGQVAKAALKEGMKHCGMSDVNEDDVWDETINIYASACYFRQMLELSNNDSFAAMIAYNQGPHSSDAKNYIKNGSLKEVEALKYVAKATFLKGSITDTKLPNIPSVKDLENKVKAKSK